jgi:hypothetical protein
MFNFRDNGNEELIEALGFIGNEELFKSLEQPLKIELLQSRKEFGATTIDTLIAFYESEDYNIPGDTSSAHAFLTTAVKLFQAVIAKRAYLIAAPNLDLIHTSSGRKFSQDDRIKSAFEHQINRSDDSIELQLELAIEAFIEHLNLDDDDLTGWKSSSQFLDLRKTFFESYLDFQACVDIGENRKAFRYLLPLIGEIQRSHVRAILGRDNYNSLLDRWKSRTETSEDLELISEIRPALALMTMSRAAIRFSAKWYEDGFFTRFNSALKGSKSLSQEDRQDTSNGFLQDAKLAFEALEHYLTSLRIQNGELLEVPDPFAMNDPSNKFFRA